MRLIDADAMAESLEYDVELDARALDSTDLVGPEREHVQFDKDCKQNCIWYLTEQATIPAPRWHRVEDELPDENKEAIFYYELTGISGTVYKNISIIYLCDLISLGYRPIAWMEKPEPPKEGAK